MGEFKTIETQEELNGIIAERLKREKEKYADYEKLKADVESLTNQLSLANQALKDKENENIGLNTQIEELSGKIKSYELASLKTTIALKNGLPYDLAQKLVGDDEDGLNTDAQNLVKLIGIKEHEFVAPLKSTENRESGKSEAYRNLLNELNIEGD